MRTRTLSESRLLRLVTFAALYFAQGVPWGFRRRRVRRLPRGSRRRQGGHRRIASSLCQSAFNAASLGFFMTLSNPAIGATQFSIYMAATNLTYAWTAKVGGWLGEHVGVERTFALAAAIQIVTVGLLPLCDPRAAEARFRA